MRILKALLFLILLLVSGTQTFAQNDSINQRILLVGDAGELTGGKQPELELLKALYSLDDARTSLIFLGDNIYPHGLPAEGAKNYEEKRIILQNQAALVKDKLSRAFIIPGNHDWQQGKKDGWEQIKHQSKYIQSLQEDNVHFVPEGGCPGPVEIKLSDEIVMVVIDTQWWLHPYDKPGITSDCDCKTTDDIIASLKDIVYRNRNKLLLFASHHPFKSYGKHGGYFTLKQHIFPLTEINPALYVPLPIIGSIYPLSRSIFGNIQDTRHPIYKNMIRSIDDVLKTHPYCIRTSGHEHNLQLIENNGEDYIISGGGSKSGEVKKRGNALFAAGKTGFAVLEILKNGNVWIKYFSTKNIHAEQPLFTAALKQFEPVSEADVFSQPIKLSDSATTSGASYFKADAFKRFLLGSNYRQEWNEPVRVPVFDIGKEKGGLKPLQRGGGKQSKSLRLEAADGKQYVLRSIEKFPDKALQKEFRETFIKDLVKDGISASYPYSGLSVPAIAEAAGVPHADPRLVFVPADPRLGIYRTDFTNTLCLLEEREPGNFDKTYSTDKVYEKLIEDNDNRVDQSAVLKARLLDMFIMDFDRHEDQWRFGAKEKGKERIFSPVPRDRDQAFFITNGFLPRLISRPWLVPQLQGFRAHSKNINGFNIVARNFDRAFLAEPSEEEWKEAVKRFLTQLSDSVIEKAVKEQPAEIYKYSGETIIKTLKKRREYLAQEVMKYYKFLSRTVTVAGSDKNELFDINRKKDGSVLITVSKVNKEGDVGKKLYERILVPRVTKEIRLYGMGGDDKFYEHGDATKSIRIRLIGGAGNDHFENASTTSAGKSIVYDLKAEQNTYSGALKRKLSSAASVNYLDRRGFKYDVLAPFISASYNVDDGLYLGASLKYTRQGFRKDPFKIMHQLSINHSLATEAYHFGYKMEAIDAIGKADLLFNGSIRAPNNTINFFRYGNESLYTKEKGKSIRYYRARFDLVDAALLLRANPVEHFSLTAGPFYQYFKMNREDNLNRLIASPSLNGLDSTSLYKRKSYSGLQFSTLIDTRDDTIMPGRGIRWQTFMRVNKGLGDYAKNFSQLNSDLSLFMSFHEPANFVIAQRFGGGVNFGNYEFFQAQFLSGTENLRGFRKYRFAGDKILFSNTELRIKLTDLNTYVLPGALGILGFFDAGRVWVKRESSSKWHSGYGAGLWLTPFKKFVVTASYTASEEGGLPLISLGFQF